MWVKYSIFLLDTHTWKPRFHMIMKGRLFFGVKILLMLPYFFLYSIKVTVMVFWKLYANLKDNEFIIFAKLLAMYSAYFAHIVGIKINSEMNSRIYCNVHKINIIVLYVTYMHTHTFLIFHGPQYLCLSSPTPTLAFFFM